MHKHAKASPAQEAQKSTCTSISKKEHITECVLSAIILGWDEGYGGREGEGRQQNAPAIQHKLGTAELHCQKSVCISEMFIINREFSPD